MFDVVGTTPQRRELSYPRTLVRTGRHSGVLSDFRKNYTVEEDIVDSPLADLSLPEIEVVKYCHSIEQVANL